MLGVTFKENCPDIRNSKVVDVVRELKGFGTNVDIYDPEASSDELHHEYGFSLIPALNKKYHAIILAVSHQQFNNIDWKSISHDNAVIYDVKGFLPRERVTARL
jgi:UDP-N-acetyl-D-galactosamine dehydrogenase